MAEVSQRRLAAVLFSDIKGYSQQMGADEAGTLQRLQVHNQIFRAEADLHHGRVIKTIGDAFMVEFASAVDAVGCALAVQRALAAHNLTRPAAEHIDVRMGVHVGDVIAQDNDLFGETVNLAARLEPKAPVGGVCVSETVLLQVRRKVKAFGTDLGFHALKNIADPVRLYALTPAGELLENPRALVAPGRRPRFGWLLGATVAAGLVALGVSTLGSPRQATGGVLRVGMMQDRGELDLYTHVPGIGLFATRYVVEAAATMSTAGEIVPGVLERWVERDGGKTVDLYLRPSARFHAHPCLGPERPVTKADLAFSIKQSILNETSEFQVVGARAFKVGKAAELEGINGLEGPGPLTLTLEQPSPFVDMALSSVMIVPAGLETCGERVNHLKQPVGTGPFRFTAAPLDDTFELVQVPGYSGPGGRGPSPLDGIRFTRISDAIDGLSMLRRQELDVLSLSLRQAHEVLDGVAEGRPRFKQPDPARDPLIGLETRPIELNMWGMIVLRGTDGPMSHQKVRLALALALDRPELVKHFPVPIVPSGRVLQPNHLGHNLELQELGLNLDRARALLADAGFPGGEGLGVVSVGVNTGEADVGATLVEQAAAAGIRVTPINMGLEALDEAVRNKSVDLAAVTYSETLRGAEPYPCLPAMVNMTTHYLGPQPELTSNAALIEHLMDRQDRRKLYAKLEADLLSVLWYIPIAVFPPTMLSSVHLVSKRVQNYVDPVTGRVAAEGRLPLSKVSLSPQF